MDTQRLKNNLARVMMHGDEVPLFFFSDLFLRHPETRGMFPVGMDVTRDRLVQALARIVADVDNIDMLVPFLQGLGRDHRKFGAVPDHFGAVGTSLIAALRHFSGPDWSAELEADWKAAYGVVANVMIEAAAKDEQAHPPWWDATVVTRSARSTSPCCAWPSPSRCPTVRGRVFRSSRRRRRATGGSTRWPTRPARTGRWTSTSA